MDGHQTSNPREEEESVGLFETLAPAGGGSKGAGRVEIDTSAPFVSVKEAVDRFGGSALWKSQLKQLFLPEKHHCFEEVEVIKLEEQAAQLEKDLIVKEKEALDVLKELEITKRIVDGLKLKLQKESFEVTNIPEIRSDITKVDRILETEELHPKNLESHENLSGQSTGAGLILMELEQLKVNLNRTMGDLVVIRASVKLLNDRIEKEKALLQRTREKLTSSTAEVSSLQEELNRTKLKLQLIGGAENPSDISSEIKQPNSETEQFQKMTEADKSEVTNLAAEIEQSESNIKTAEIRCLAAKKMEEAAKAAEAVALAESKAVMNGNTPALDFPSCVTLSVEEYVVLTRKAQDADEMSRKKTEDAMLQPDEDEMSRKKTEDAMLQPDEDEMSRKKTEDAMLQLDEANQSKVELIMKVEEAAAEVKTSTKALEEALNRLEAANLEKLPVEEALRGWRSERGQKRRYVRSSTNFKNSYPIHSRENSSMPDLNKLSPLGPTLSIGEILSRKLMGPEEDYEVGTIVNTDVKPTASLGQILNKRRGILSPRSTEDISSRKQLSAKRKKFGFVGFSLLLAKQNKRKKRDGTADD